MEADQSDVEEMEDEDEGNDGKNNGLWQVHGREIAVVASFEKNRSVCRLRPLRLGTLEHVLKLSGPQT